MTQFARNRLTQFFQLLAVGDVPMHDSEDRPAIDHLARHNRLGRETPPRSCVGPGLRGDGP